MQSAHIPDARSGRRLAGIRRYSLGGLLGLTLLAGQCAPAQCTPAPAPAPAPAPPASVVQLVVDRTNAERAAAGLPALSVDSRLTAAAQAHSVDQATNDTMTHAGSDGSRPGDRVTREGYTWQAVAENVAYGYPDAASVMDAWMDSAGHRSNILRRNVTQIGVGLAYSANGTPYWTQVFAAPR